MSFVHLKFNSTGNEAGENTRKQDEKIAGKEKKWELALTDLESKLSTFERTSALQSEMISKQEKRIVQQEKMISEQMKSREEQAQNVRDQGLDGIKI